MKLKFILDRYCGVNPKGVSSLIERYAPSISVSEKNYDAVIIVGGDGSFLNNALDYKKPVLLIEGVHKGHLKSIGSLTGHEFSDLPKILKKLAAGDFKTLEEPILELRYTGKTYLSIGDFYVERIDTKEALRYKAIITYGMNKAVSYAISNGFIVTTPIGSTGYFSYIDKIEHRQPKRINGIGFAHILPSTVKDFINGRKVPYKIRRAFPPHSRIEVLMERNAAYLFGVPGRNSGIKVNGGRISIKASQNTIRRLVL